MRFYPGSSSKNISITILLYVSVRVKVAVCQTTICMIIYAQELYFKLLRTIFTDLTLCLLSSHITTRGDRKVGVGDDLNTPLT